MIWIHNWRSARDAITIKVIDRDLAAFIIEEGEVVIQVYRTAVVRIRAIEYSGSIIPLYTARGDKRPVMNLSASFKVRLDSEKATKRQEKDVLD